MKKKLIVAGLFIAGLMGFAGTCTFQHISLTTVGSSKIFAGEVHNDTAANVLQHNVVVAFIGAGGTVLETQTVTPCLRSLPAGGVDFFSATSTAAGASATAGLARVAGDSTLKLGSTAAGSASFSGVTAKRAGTALTAAGTVTNTDTSALASPIVCAVAFSAAGDVLSVSTGALADLAAGASSAFSVTVLVPDASGVADHVDLYVDGLKGGVPTTPSSSLGNRVTVPVAGPGSAAMLVFTQNPGGGTGGTAWAQQPTVALEDNNGHVIAGDNATTVTLSIATNPGPGTLTCTSTTVTVVAGVATFAGCKIDKIGTGYTLSAAASSSVAGATSAAFNVTVGAAAKLAFTTQPGNATGHASSATPLTPQPVVSVEDAGGNVVTTATNSITLTLNGAGVLACTTNPLAAVAGVATFAGCWVNAASTPTDTLTASSAGLTSATSNTFTVG